MLDYSPERWQRLKDTYARYWAGELERPVAGVVMPGRDPGRPQPAAPLLSQATCHDFSWTPEQLIDRIDWEISRMSFLGDAFPYFNMDCFGPGVGAAFLGARLDNASGRVWFFAPDDRPIQDVHFVYDPGNPWLQRVKAIYHAAVQRWQGQVIIGMTDLGGILDILSSFRPSEQLLMDLYDHPQEVERLVWEAHEAWHRFYNEINAIIAPVTPGYSDWSYMYSDRPSYILQCDFSYMISPKMFKRFVQPEMAATCRRLPRSFYHLDGVGEIPHLDLLLEIPELNGIQWIHGDGKPDSSHWPELFQRIHRAGKRIQITSGGFDALRAVIDQIGSANGVQMMTQYFPRELEDQAVRSLEAFGIEA